MADHVYDGVTIEEMTALLREFGFRAERKSGADNLLLSAAGGWRFVIFLNRAAGDAKFTNVYLYSGHEDTGFSIADGNAWNDDKRFAKAHVDRDGYPIIEYDFFVDGVTKAYLRRCFGMWEVLLAVFMESMGKPGSKAYVKV